MADGSALQRIPISARAYGKARDQPQGTKRPRQRGRPRAQPSGWSLTWDVETTVDAAQQLRVGAYQVREFGALREAGFLYDPTSLSDTERATLYRYALDHELEVRMVDEFVDHVFFRVLIDLRGTCVTFNGSFDASRIAIAHGPALSPSYRGGFSLALSPDPRRPHIQIRHLSGAESLIRFTQPDEQPTPRGMRKRQLQVPPFRGFFADVRTLAVALLEHRGDLRSLGKLLGTPAQKGQADFGADTLTPEFLAYAMGDVQLTWECYERLAVMFARIGLDRPLPSIYSAASIGKGLLEAMRIRPWTQVQPDFPDGLIGILMSSYYGGRSEVHLRRVICQVVYADFLSMYPTVCSLLGLWPFVVAQGVVTRDATAEVCELLSTLAVDDLQRPELWRRLVAVVQLDPDDDVLPVRGAYDEGSSNTIGLNRLSGEKQPFWYPLPDVVNAVLLGAKTPHVLRAIAFEPGPVQEGLAPVDLMGNPAYRVDPVRDDAFRRLIELRSEIKRRRDEAKEMGKADLARRLDAEQQALKITVNSASYGILVELNVTEWAAPQPIDCYGRAGSYATTGYSTERPGRFFHPLLATLITAAARLLLGLAECRILASGLDWAFCDTDSMAIARPPDMPEPEFLARAQAVLAWFEPLKPYAIDEPLFKLEDANLALDATGRPTDRLDSLYCFAISDKRYVLFNIGPNGRPVLRKASAHGLGHLRPPYDEADAPRSIPAPVVRTEDLGVLRWQHDLWYRIVEAALDGHPNQVQLDDLPGFDAPALSRYAATTPTLLHWFDTYNQSKAYREQVRPFGFLSAFQARRDTEPVVIDEVGTAARAADAAEPPAVAAPFDKDPRAAAKQAFDRNTGEPVPEALLLTYRESLAQYHLHPEAKFEGGEYLDAGPTRRRHVAPLGPIIDIGKEANRWEEQTSLGVDPSAQIAYGPAPHEAENYRSQIAGRLVRFPLRKVAAAAGLSVGTVFNVLHGVGVPKFRTLIALDRALANLDKEGVTHASGSAREPRPS